MSPDPGRNDPCPCGSGRVYRKCCGKNAAPSPERVAQHAHRVDEKLTVRILRLAKELSGPNDGSPHAAYPGDLRDEQAPADLLSAWVIHYWQVRGKAPVEWLAERQRHLLDEDERTWLDAQRRAWLSVWAVRELQPEVGFALEDLLTGERRFVHEVIGSRTGRPQMILLGRVVDWRGVSVLSGLHLHALPPEHAAAIVERTRAKLDVRLPLVPCERLRTREIVDFLIELWEEISAESSNRPIPELRNGDGDPLAWTTDRYSVVAARESEVVERLAAIPGIGRRTLEGGRVEEGRAEFDFVRPVGEGAPGLGLGDTHLGTVRVQGGDLVLEANSVRRADDLRACIEAACAGLLEHRQRESRKMADLLGEAGYREPAPPMDESPRAAALLREVKRRHYEGKWLDDPVPALANLSPRAAARDPVGRGMLVQLLNDMEYHEAGEPPERRYDVRELRRILGV